MARMNIRSRISRKSAINHRGEKPIRSRVRVRAGLYSLVGLHIGHFAPSLLERAKPKQRKQSLAEQFSAALQPAAM